MDEFDNSGSGSSIEEILMKYRNRVGGGRISNCLSVEPSQKSNIIININVPTTSLKSGTASKKEKKKTVPTKTQKENTARKNKYKVNSPRRNTPQGSANEGNKADPGYITKSRYNYFKLTSKQLYSIVRRARIFCETGVVLSDEEDNIPCQNKHKQKPPMKTVWKQRGPRVCVCGTKFGHGRIGPFGVRKCVCCNVSKDNSEFPEIMEGIYKRTRNQHKQREDRFLQIQGDLLELPELVDSDHSQVTTRPVPDRSASVENSPYMLPLDEVPESSRIPAANLQTYNVRTEFSSDFAHLDRSNETLRTPQSKRFRESQHLSMPSSSKPKVPMSQSKESDIMNLVDSLMMAEEESIKLEAQERCEQMLKTVERTRNVFQDALDEVLITSDGSTKRCDYRLDNPVEIIEPFPEILNNNPLGDNNFVQVIESDKEVILVDFNDTPLPSTSRPIRSTRRKRMLEESSASVPKKKNN